MMKFPKQFKFGALLCLALGASLRAMDPEPGALLLAQVRELIQAEHFESAFKLVEAGLRQSNPALNPAGGNPDLALVCEAIGKAFLSRGRLGDAATCVEQALRLRAEEAAPLPRTETMTLLGRIYWRQRRLGEAQLMFEEVVELKAEALGAEHPDLDHALANLTIFQVGVGQGRQAIHNLQRLAALRERVLGADHGEVGDIYLSLGFTAQQFGDPALAEPALLKALAILEHNYGQSNPLVAQTLAVLGANERLLGHLEAAEKYLVRAVDMYDALPDPANRERAKAVKDLADLYRASHRNEQATRLLYRESVSRYRAKAPPAVPRRRPKVPADPLPPIAEDAPETPDRR